MSPPYEIGASGGIRTRARRGLEPPALPLSYRRTNECVPGGANRKPIGFRVGLEPAVARVAGMIKKCPSLCDQPATHPTASAQDARDDSAADGQVPLTHRKAQVLLQRHRLLQLNLYRRRISGHEHLDAVGERQRSRHARGPEIEGRLIARENRRTAASLLLPEHEDTGLEGRPGTDRARPGD